MSDVFSTPGAFSWNELMTTDMDAAKSFYHQLFGWDIKDSNMGDTIYSVIEVAGKQVAGMMPIPPQAAGAPPQWGAYVTVEDVDAMAAKVVELGGKVLLPPQDIPTVGRFCVFQDPQGATLSAITYEMKAE